MKNLTSFLLSCVLVAGTAACNNAAKTSADAPQSGQDLVKVNDVQATQAAKSDAQNEIRRKQLNSDIRAREQRNNWTGGDRDRNPRDLASEVRSKLEANIPNGHLAVEAKEDGTVYVSGTVANKQQLNKISPLAREIKGVTFVVQKVTVAEKS